MSTRTGFSRRDFARLLAVSGSAALLPGRAFAQPLPRELLAEFGLTDAPLPRTPAEPDERYWQEVRARFLLPRDLAFINAANLCPASLPSIEALERNTRDYEAFP